MLYCVTHNFKTMANNNKSQHPQAFFIVMEITDILALLTMLRMLHALEINFLYFVKEGSFMYYTLKTIF